ncbi:MAG: DUF4835 family protein [Balneolaceae bacterium]|nr:DUF4835 family protein [Balneolaceae bacterium]
MKLSSFQENYPVTFVLSVAFALLFLPFRVHAQEINATVQVDRSQINSASINYLDNLSTDIESYLNEHDWIGPNYMEHERINATIQITLMSVDNNFNFEANIVVRSQRPIYNTTQQTTVFLYNDENWTFNYTPNRGFVHDELQFDELTTLLDFYAYIIIGYDFDTFSELGGSPYFSEANNLVAIGQTTSSTGWSRTSSTRRNRAQLIADLLNPNFRLLRRASYIYHRLGVDQFLSNPVEARQEILRALEMIEEAKGNTINNLLFDTFFNAKYREFVSIFEDAKTEVRLEAYNLLTNIDQGHLTEYNKLQ